MQHLGGNVMRVITKSVCGWCICLCRRGIVIKLKFISGASRMISNFSSLTLLLLFLIETALIGFKMTELQIYICKKVQVVKRVWQ